jgi:hypothetical protein
LDAKDTPYVQGTIIMNGPWPDEWLVAGFVGKGADGKRYSNGAVGKFSPGSNAGTTSSSHGPQLTSVFGNGQQGVGYRHVKMPPGEYLIFVERNCVKLLAWKRVTVKPGDQLRVDLTIDPAKAGSLVVTWPEKNPFNSDGRPLALDPVELDGSGLIPSDSDPLVFVKNGVDTITLTGVPAGKYHVRSLWRGEDVEVKPGTETQVTFKKFDRF